MSAIKNIIFDFGGVLFNIDYHLTTRAFLDLGVQNFESLYSQFTANSLFEDLETGKISEADFYKELRSYSGLSLSDQAIEKAWKSMLLSYRIESLQYLETLRPQYRLFLLSNTNSIHKRGFEQMLKDALSKPNVDGYFEKAYYSHLIHYRKPYADIYQYVLADGQLVAEESLFIDDSINNIEAAAKLGFKTHLLLPDERIEGLDIFHA